MDIKISIIIPMYNAEKYLDECITSIINQTYKNYELILIDDGSTDCTRKICEKYVDDKKVLYFRQENSGVSTARNKGISIASGDYIVFVDADDYVENGLLERIIYNISEDTFLMFGYKEKYCNRTIDHVPDSYNGKMNDNIYNIFLDNSDICGFLVNKVFNLEIIKKNDLKLDEDIFLCEDLLFNINYLKYVKKIKIISFSPYFYRMRSSSATWTKNKNKYDNLKKCFSIIKKIFDDKKIDEKKLDFFALVIYLKYCPKKQKNELKTLYNQVVKNCSMKEKIKIMVFFRFSFVYDFYMFFKKKTFKLYS